MKGPPPREQERAGVMKVLPSISKTGSLCLLEPTPNRNCAHQGNGPKDRCAGAGFGDGGCDGEIGDSEGCKIA